jgi:single-strand DNA-binding protein
MKTLNRIELIGYVGRDPEATQTASGTPIARFNLATTKRWRGAGDEPKEHTDWHRIVFFGPAATHILDHVKRGSLVRVDGELRVSTYEKDGATRTSVEVRGADWIDFGVRARSGEVPLANGAVPPHADPPVDDDLPL